MKQVTEQIFDDPLTTISRLLTEKEGTGLRACVKTRSNIMKRFQDKPPYRFVVRMIIQECKGEEKKWGKLLRPNTNDLFMEVMYLLDRFLAGDTSVADTSRLITVRHFRTFYQDFLEQAAGAGRQGEWPSNWFRDAVKEKEQGLLSACDGAPEIWWLAEKIVFEVVCAVISQLKKTLPACSVRADEFLEALSCQCNSADDREGAKVPVPRRLPDEMKDWLKSYASASNLLSERICHIILTSCEEVEMDCFHRGKETRELLDLLTVHPVNAPEKSPNAILPTASPAVPPAAPTARPVTPGTPQPTIPDVQLDMYFLQPTAYFPPSAIEDIQPASHLSQPSAQDTPPATADAPSAAQNIPQAADNRQPTPADVQFSAYDLQPATQGSRPSVPGLPPVAPCRQTHTPYMQPAGKAAPSPADTRRRSTPLQPKEERLRRMKALFRNPVTGQYNTSDIRLLDSLLHALTAKGMLDRRDSLPVKKKFTRQMIGLLSKMLFSKDSPDAPAWHRFPDAYATPFALLFGMGENQIRDACSTALRSPRAAQLKAHIRRLLPPGLLPAQPA